jgi:hypothetical protein
MQILWIPKPTAFFLDDLGFYTRRRSVAEGDSPNSER